MIDIKNNRYKYFELIRELAITDFKLKYQGSVFGYLWSLVKPLAYFAVLYTVFTKVFHIGSDIPHYPIYLLFGVMTFSFWGETTAMAMSSIVYKGDLIRKVYFPRIVLVISSTLTSLITYSLNLLVLMLFAYLKGTRLKG
jgi:ABC-2 type transport system permease protein